MMQLDRGVEAYRFRFSLAFAPE
jgi:hypothetical protein